MSESWKQWERQIVNSRFLLQRYLGGSEHSAVFLTERGIPPQKIAIKFIQVDEPDAQLQLSRWQHAAKLSHPHLLRNFESGRCRLGDFDLLYVLMEYAEENLSQFLSQRPLTPAEARDVLTPALQALAFLHGEGLVTDMCGPRTFSPSKINSNSPATAFPPLPSTPRSRICLPLKHSRAPPRRASVIRAPTTRRKSPRASSRRRATSGRSASRSSSP